MAIAIRFGNLGQNKASALEKFETLENLERIGIPRLWTGASKMSTSVVDRSHCRGSTQMIAMGLKDLIQSHDTNVVK